MAETKKKWKRRFALKLSGYAALFTAATLALANALGMSEDTGAVVVLVLVFEAIVLACLLLGGSR